MGRNLLRWLAGWGQSLSRIAEFHPGVITFSSGPSDRERRAGHEPLPEPIERPTPVSSLQSTSAEQDQLISLS